MCDKVCRQLVTYVMSQQVDIARDSMQLAKERLCKNLSILSYVLDKLRSYLSNEGWIGDNPPNGVM